jgi:molecular chaperone DnaK
LGEKVPSATREDIQRRINELRQATQGEDIARIRSLSEALQRELSTIGQQMYSQTAASGSAGSDGRGGQSPGEGEVVEGEFREA